jgi:hypothetical protein
MNTGSYAEREYLTNVGRVAEALERIAESLEQLTQAQKGKTGERTIANTAADGCAPRGEL